jgi:hypothetical protein
VRSINKASCREYLILKASRRVSRVPSLSWVFHTPKRVANREFSAYGVTRLSLFWSAVERCDGEQSVHRFSSLGRHGIS